MAKPEWGAKRTCLSCGTKFYDFARDPIVCPSCEAAFKVEVPGKQRRSARTVSRSKPAPEQVDEAAAAKVDDAKDADAVPDGVDEGDPKVKVDADEDEEVAIAAEAGLIDDDEEGADEDENMDNVLEADSNEDIEAELNSEIDADVEKEKEG